MEYEEYASCRICDKKLKKKSALLSPYCFPQYCGKHVPNDDIFDIDGTKLTRDSNSRLNLGYTDVIRLIGCPVCGKNKYEKDESREWHNGMLYCIEHLPTTSGHDGEIWGPQGPKGQDRLVKLMGSTGAAIANGCATCGTHFKLKTWKDGKIYCVEHC